MINSGHTFGESDFRGTNAWLYPRTGDYAVLTATGDVALSGFFDEQLAVEVGDLATPIETIFLDAGGVLVWPNWTRVSQALRMHDVTVSPQQLAAADPLARLALDRAEVIAASTDQRRGWTYFDLVLTHAGVPLSEHTAAALDGLQEYHRTENLWETVPDFVVPALQQLRTAGYRLVVMSNANGTLHHAFTRLGLAPLVDIIVDSAVEGVEKPDRRFFELGLTRSGAHAESTVHVGDLYHVDVTGARAAGLKAILVDEGDLRPDVDCPRIRSIAALPELLASD